MSKNFKGRKLRTKGLGVRNFKRSLHITNCGGGDSHGFLHEVPLHTPAIHVSKKVNGKTVKETIYIKDEKTARRGQIQRAKDIRSGKCSRHNNVDLTTPELRQGAINNIMRDVERPGLVSRNWKGSNRHDRPRDDVPEKQEEAAQQEETLKQEDKQEG